MFEFFKTIIEKKNVKQYLISIFIGLVLFIISNHTFINNRLSSTNIPKEYNWIFIIVFDLILAYIFTQLITFVYLKIQTYKSQCEYNNRQQNKNNKVLHQSSAIINSLSLQDKQALLSIIKHNNQGTYLYIQNETFMYKLLSKNNLIMIPGTTQNNNEYHPYCCQHGKYLLNNEIYNTISLLYDKKLILQDL